MSRPAEGHGLLTRFAFALYRFSLRAYPRAFRAQHESELHTVLDERWNAEIRGRAAGRALRFWVRMVGLTLLGGFAERLGIGAHGTVLIEVLQGGRIRVEWLGTHEPGGDFTGQARIYER